MSKIKYKISNTIVGEVKRTGNSGYTHLVVAKNMKITKRKAVNLINASNGKIFTATFVKKDGTDRVMNCRKGVKSYLNGGELAFDPKAKGLIVVFDVQKKAYRMIGVKTLKALKINGEIYTVKG